MNKLYKYIIYLLVDIVFVIITVSLSIYYETYVIGLNAILMYFIYKYIIKDKNLPDDKYNLRL